MEGMEGEAEVGQVCIEEVGVEVEVPVIDVTASATAPEPVRFWGRSKYRMRVVRDDVEAAESMPDYTLITEPHQVAEAERFVAKAQWIAIDTESNILFVYQPRVCLIQMNVEGVLLVFDTMALMQADPLALEPLRPYLEDGQRLIFAHGGVPISICHPSISLTPFVCPVRAAANDVSTFKRDFGISLNGSHHLHLLEALSKARTFTLACVVCRVCVCVVRRTV